MSQKQKSEHAPPHVFVWVSVVQTIAQIAEKEGMTQVKAALTTRNADIEQRGITAMKAAGVTEIVENKQKFCMEEIARDVKMCKVVECYHSATHRIETLTHPGSTAHAFVVEMTAFLMSKCTGKMKTGSAPKGRLERQIQDWIDVQRQSES